jgi:RNA polymerase sigma-70 factor (ECF subfamily)
MAPCRALSARDLWSPLMAFDTDLVEIYGRLKARAISKCLNFSDAADLVQETMVRCMERRDQFEAGTNLYGWAARVMNNLLIDKYRKKTETLVEADTLSALGGSVESGVAIKLDILKCLEGLPESQRQPLLLNSVQGFTAQEIADQLSTKLNTVLSQLARARKLFGACINQAPALAT